MNLLKNFKKDDILMLVVAFLLGYFAHRILKGCQTVEGAEVMSAADMSTAVMMKNMKNINCGGSETYKTCLEQGPGADGNLETLFNNCLTEEYNRCFSDKAP